MDKLLPVYQDVSARFDNQNLKQLFEQKGYNSELKEVFNDTSQINWIPSWDNGIRESKNDSTQFIYIPLQPELVNSNTNQVIRM